MYEMSPEEYQNSREKVEEFLRLLKKQDSIPAIRKKELRARRKRERQNRKKGRR